MTDLSEKALSDQALTEAGLDVETSAAEARPGGRALILACGALAREILALIDANRWSWLDLRCLPAKLHNTPQLLPERVREALRRARAEGYETVFVAYGDCGTGGLLDAVLAEEGAERIDGPHCYSFFDGNDAFAARAEDEVTAFYLTDFLARQFDALVWRGLGLDRHPDLRDIYFANYDRLVYLAQTEDESLERAARAAAERLGLRYERRFTGYGDLSGFLSRAADESR